MIHQAGKKGDFMPENQTYTEGNDDQCFWALSAMIAAERNFPAPPSETPSWLAMVQAVFNEQANRWDTSACGGGLRWQIYTWNSGYLYRNSIANGCFFDISSRLARYTGNETYAKWATKAWNWSHAIGLIGDNYEIFDGVTDVDNCTSHDHNRWSYNAGIWLHGASVMYNYTSEEDASSEISATWRERTDGLLKATDNFFPKDNIMFEPNCESSGKCNVDQLSFKAYLSRWLAEVTQYAPYTYNSIMSERLRPTAIAAVAQCQGGDTGTFCGHKWSSGKYDGTTGVGQQMGVLEVLQGLLAADVGGALTSSTGGKSEGNSAAGTGEHETKAELLTMHIDNGDRAGAGIVTALFVSLVAWACYGMIS
jgi:mannan endo-1,6-alpha-mannosidase